jgi:D-alanine-D-alanine ligase
VKTVILHDYVPSDATPDQMDNLHQMQSVRSALNELGHETISLAVADSMEETSNELRRLAPDRVFNLVESVQGSGRWIHLAPEMLQKAGLPYTGGSSTAILETTNKLMAKNRLRQAGLPTPDWITMDSASAEVSGEARYIVKSTWEHASFGMDEFAVITVRDIDALRLELENRALTMGGEWFAEEYIDGREFNLSLLATMESTPEVLPPAEILFPGFGPDMTRIVGYRAKWVADSFEYSHTPRTFEMTGQDADLLRHLVDLSLKCWALFGLRGWARVDFRVDHDNRPCILEINANPCLAEDAGFIASARRAGLDYPQVIERILNDVK